MHSHHSHSGDYVAHATDTLEAIVSRAEEMGFSAYCLTEHMPRLDDRFLYPEERDREYTTDVLEQNFGAFLRHAVRLQKAYSARNGMQVLVGFEIEGLDQNHIAYARKLLDDPNGVNMAVGSVHYVHEIPIDFNSELWLAAQQKTAEKTARALYRDYYALQNQVIEGLKPSVVGHFDLIRLFAPAGQTDPTTGKTIADIDVQKDWPEVWDQIVANIRKVVEYGGLFELNAAAIRKGWALPYPQADVGREIARLGGRFCLSDDAHSVAQVGLNYAPMWKYVKDVLQLESVFYLALEGEKTVVRSVTVEEASKSVFWRQLEK